MFRLPVREGVWLEIMEERHAEAIFAVVDRDREHLRKWLPWVDATINVEYTREYIRNSLERFAKNEGFSVGVWVQGQLAGGSGFHKLDWLNRKSEIGYWLATEYEGQGIITDVCRQLVTYTFQEWKMNRAEIHCAVGNTRSAAVPRRLGFKHEATLSSALLLHNIYHDLHIFGMLAGDWRMTQS